MPSAKQLWEEEILLDDDSSASTDGVLLDVAGWDFVAVHLIASDAWNGQIDFEADRDGWGPIQGEKVKNGSLVATATGTTLNEKYRFDVSALKRFRTRVSGRTVGSIKSTARRQVA